MQYQAGHREYRGTVPRLHPQDLKYGLAPRNPGHRIDDPGDSDPAKNHREHGFGGDTAPLVAFNLLRDGRLERSPELRRGSLKPVDQPPTPIRAGCVSQPQIESQHVG